MVGQQQTASKSIERLLDLDPTLKISTLKELTPLRRSADQNRYVEGLRKAGLPE